MCTIASTQARSKAAPSVAALRSVTQQTWIPSHKFSSFLKGKCHQQISKNAPPATCATYKQAEKVSRTRSFLRRYSLAKFEICFFA